MSLRAELEALQKKREEHVEAIGKIDAELEQVRAVLSVAAAPSLSLSQRHTTHYFSLESHTAQRILTALIEKEPASIADLSARTGISKSVVYQCCHSLAKAEKLYSYIDTAAIGRPRYYARGKALLEGLQFAREKLQRKLEGKASAPAEAGNTPVPDTTPAALSTTAGHSAFSTTTAAVSGQNG